MLAERLERWSEERYLEGWRRGYREGWLEGFQEGLRKARLTRRAELLQRLLQRKFGELPAWATQRLAHATDTDISRWADTIFTSDTLEQALSSEPAPRAAPTRQPGDASA